MELNNIQENRTNPIPYKIKLYAVAGLQPQVKESSASIFV